eukprot:5569004-Prymnesium_polylepis.1
MRLCGRRRVPGARELERRERRRGGAHVRVQRERGRLRRLRGVRVAQRLLRGILSDPLSGRVPQLG